jgi:hypothetical protein
MSVGLMMGDLPVTHWSCAMNSRSKAKDRLLPLFILSLLALVLFAVGLTNRLGPTARELTVGAVDQQPKVLSCIMLA